MIKPNTCHFFKAKEGSVDVERAEYLGLRDEYGSPFPQRPPNAVCAQWGRGGQTK